jgi:hypothetical protein
MKKQINERALAARLGRHFARQGEALKKCAPQTRDFLKLGKYYVVSLQLNAIIDTDVDLESLAREEGILKQWEELAGEVK